MSDFRDIEKDLVTWVQTLPLIDHAGIIAPNDLEAKLVFCRVVNLGGPDDGVTDSPTVDFDVFASTRDLAWSASSSIRTALRPRARVGGAIIDSVRTTTSPRLLPWSNEKIKRYSATYSLGLRR